MENIGRVGGGWGFLSVEGVGVDKGSPQCTVVLLLNKACSTSEGEAANRTEAIAKKRLAFSRTMYPHLDEDRRA